MTNGPHLIRDATRVATPSLRGYVYQLLQTLRSWLDLVNYDQLIVAEGNEDIDKFALAHPSLFEEEQVKYRTSPIAQSDETIGITALRYLEAFHFHHVRGHQFHGVLRTNAKVSAQPSTAVGKWLLGKPVPAPTLRKELRRLAKGDRARFKPFIDYIHTNAMTKLFVNSVDWVSDAGDIARLRHELESAVTLRAPRLSPAAGVRALIVHMLQVMTSDNVEKRTVGRLDADIVLNDAALDALQQAASASGKSLLTLWSRNEPTGAAVAVFTTSGEQIDQRLNKVVRKWAISGKTMPQTDALILAAAEIDLVAYVSLRSIAGPPHTRREGLRARCRSAEPSSTHTQPDLALQDGSFVEPYDCQGLAFADSNSPRVGWCAPSIRACPNDWGGSL